MRDWNNLESLIIIAGHAIFLGRPGIEVLDDSNWVLEPFQIGEPRFYLEHIAAGVKAAAEDESALLLFSGGQTRKQAGPRSEAQSYWALAELFNWWELTVQPRASTEEYARDSYENLLFSICRFFECTGRFPRRVSLISWSFKKARFELHREAIRFPTDAFTFHGVNDPEDLTAAVESERKLAVVPFTRAPYGACDTDGTPSQLAVKRNMRNPFRRIAPYRLSCPGLADLLSHRGPELFSSKLPWYDPPDAGR